MEKDLRAKLLEVEQKTNDRLSDLNVVAVHPQNITAKVTDASAAAKAQDAVIDSAPNSSAERGDDSSKLTADAKAFVNAYAKERGIDAQKALATLEGEFIGQSTRVNNPTITSSEILKNDVNFSAKGLYSQMSAQEKTAYDVYTFAVTSAETTIKVTGTVPRSIVHAGATYVPLRATNKLWRCSSDDRTAPQPGNETACQALTDLDWGKTGALPATEQNTADEVKAAAALQTTNGIIGSAGCVVTKNSLPNRIYGDISKSTAEGDAYARTFFAPVPIQSASLTSEFAKNDEGIVSAFTTDEDGCDQAAAEVVEPTVCVVPPTTPKDNPKTPTPKMSTPKNTPKATPKTAPVDKLASTGADVAAIALGALMLLAAGAAAFIGARKKRN